MSSRNRGSNTQFTDILRFSDLIPSTRTAEPPRGLALRNYLSKYFKFSSS